MSKNLLFTKGKLIPSWRSDNPVGLLWTDSISVIVWWGWRCICIEFCSKIILTFLIERADCVINLIVWVTRKANAKSHPRSEQFLLSRRGRGVVLKALIPLAPVKFIIFQLGSKYFKPLEGPIRKILFSTQSIKFKNELWQTIILSPFFLLCQFCLLLATNLNCDTFVLSATIL